MYVAPVLTSSHLTQVLLLGLLGAVLHKHHAAQLGEAPAFVLFASSATTRRRGYDDLIG